MSHDPVQAELIAVLVAVTHGDPRVLTIESGTALPSGQLETGHRSLQTGLRAWVERQTHHPLGYVEQLYTFTDQQRPHGLRSISISYLGLSREGATTDPDTAWCSWYIYFPWEDRRRPTSLINRVIMPRLADWSGDNTARRLRVASLFGQEGRLWNEELVLQRYELLYEAGLVQEAIRARPSLPADPLPGSAMNHDHRRILATAIARLRAKIKYRPVVFELLPSTFTMLELQQAIEALAGQTLHKPNFRRLIEQQDLVEETGQVSAGLAGRPAKLFRFRPSVLEEREFSGTKLPLIR
ncbi:MAG TPA: hypothetical protein VNC39_03725 [Acidocella sp.]|uniref:NUDIX hydrolase n=1 Tax=Acidocella sp. TaxID=50710 RepID=UPI002B92589F|nr:hypothetical protein [Acidocella sp.]HVE21060.1 hypothetical protein [Acidocella sp.]